MRSNTGKHPEFLGRIDLIASDGRWLAKIPKVQALELVGTIRAVIDGLRGDNKVASIRYTSRLGPPMKPPTPLTVASYMGQRYVVNEPIRSGNDQIGRCFQHKRLHEDDCGLIAAGLADVCTVAN